MRLQPPGLAAVDVLPLSILPDVLHGHITHAQGQDVRVEKLVIQVVSAARLLDMDDRVYAVT